ncbi:MAG: ABC transporter substrate-binding protein [Caldilinea sp.]|uniref:ABC transporter substrate-binding protein n=1 Tax=Caldilinea sp. TaxID=2293560 RepID=UPI002C458583|nr:ABC transporter substrate-binding protein [Caldilinea sp.]
MLENLVRHGLIKLAFACIALALSACGFGAQPTPTPAPVTLRYITFAGLDTAEQTLVERFRTTHPSVTMAVEQYNRAPEEYLTTAPVPDLMLITPGQFLDNAMARDALTDLTDLWAQSGAGQTVAPGLRALSEREGRQYYLPTGYNWNGVYYNKQLFEQLGLQPPRTWDEFVQLSETLWLNGVTPFAVSGGDPFMGLLWFDYLNLRLNGPAFHQEFLAGDIPFDDPRIRLAFELWASLVEKGYFLQTSGTMDIDAALAAVAPSSAAASPQAAMVLSGPAFLGVLSPQQRDALGFFPFPILDLAQPPAEVVMAIGYMIPAQAPHRDVALAFADLLASPEGRDLLMAEVVASGLYAPITGSAEDETLPASVRQGMTLVQEAESVVAPYYMSVSPAMWPALMTMQRRILTEPGSGKGFDLDGMLAALETAR